MLRTVGVSVLALVALAAVTIRPLEMAAATVSSGEVITLEILNYVPGEHRDTISARAIISPDSVCAENLNCEVGFLTMCPLTNTGNGGTKEVPLSRVGGQVIAQLDWQAHVCGNDPHKLGPEIRAVLRRFSNGPLGFVGYSPDLLAASKVNLTAVARGVQAALVSDVAGMEMCLLLYKVPPYVDPRDPSSPSVFLAPCETAVKAANGNQIMSVFMVALGVGGLHLLAANWPDPGPTPPNPGPHAHPEPHEAGTRPHRAAATAGSRAGDRGFLGGSDHGAEHP